MAHKVQNVEELQKQSRNKLFKLFIESNNDNNTVFRNKRMIYLWPV